MAEDSTPAADPASADAASPGPTPTPPAPPAAPEPPRDAPADEPDNSGLKKALEAERAARKAADQRAKAAGEEANAKAAEATALYQSTLDKLANALGFKPDEAPPDPSALQRTIAERDNELGDVKSRIETLTAEKDAAIRERDVEIAAWRAASKQGANVPALLDSRTFLASLASLDPASESFSGDLDEAVKAALVANVSLRATPPVPPPNEAGIGAAGAKNAPHVTPGIGRLRAAYS